MGRPFKDTGRPFAFGSGIYLFVQVPGSAWPRIKNQAAGFMSQIFSEAQEQLCPQAKMKHLCFFRRCVPGKRAEASAIWTYFNVTHLKLSL